MAPGAVGDGTPLQDVELKRGIANFYDESSNVWEDIWGEHMHHGYYEPGSGAQLSIDEHQEAQVLMVDKVRPAHLTDLPIHPPSRPPHPMHHPD